MLSTRPLYVYPAHSCVVCLVCVPQEVTFPCTVESSPSVPTSVHALRPSDIKVVAALGDSVTVQSRLCLVCG